MLDRTITLFIQATSRQSGALGIFQAYADEPYLARELDVRVGTKKKHIHRYSLQIKEIRYGWLRGGDGLTLDEVMLARPGDGFRVLMTHGGPATREAVTAFFRQAGFAELEDWKAGVPDGVAERDALFQPLLASCLTQTQAAAVLDAMENPGEGKCVPEALLRVRRVVVTGPPNAGKSSLLNRIAGFDRAFVHPEAGSTRDMVDELVDLGGYAVLLGDMPGFAGEGGGMAGEAWRMAREGTRFAEALLFVADASKPWDAAADAAAEEARSLSRAAGGCGRIPVVVALNKSDLPSAVAGRPWLRFFPEAEVVRVCSLPGGDAAERLDGVMAALLGRA